MLAFRLCLQLGYPHPDQLLKSMTAAQWREWLAYSGIEPFGEIRNEIRHGQQMALTVNLKRDPKQHPEPYQPKEFMNFLRQPEEIPPEETPEELADKIKALFKRGGHG